MKGKLVISLLALLAIVLIVFVYLLDSKKLESPILYEKEITKVETVSESDEVDSIEEDLNETNLDNIDLEMSGIEAQLN